MFQILVIDKEYCKLVEPPSDILSLLHKLNIIEANNYLKISYLPIIQEVYPDTLIAKLNRKAEIKHYRVPDKVKSLLALAINNQLSENEHIVLASLTDYADRHGGLSIKQYHLLWDLAYIPFYKCEIMINEIINSGHLTASKLKWLTNTLNRKIPIHALQLEGLYGKIKELEMKVKKIEKIDPKGTKERFEAFLRGDYGKW